MPQARLRLCDPIQALAVKGRFHKIPILRLADLSIAPHTPFVPYFPRQSRSLGDIVYTYGLNRITSRHLGNGQPVEAVRYRLNAKAGAITLWYSNDESRRWLALEAPAKGGRKIRYVPVQVPAAGNPLV